ICYRDWSSDVCSSALNLGAPGIVLVRVTVDGTQSPVAKLPGLPQYLYASPDRRRFAYTASNPAGWRLYVYDDDAGKVVFSGAMRSEERRVGSVGGDVG